MAEGHGEGAGGPLEGPRTPSYQAILHGEVKLLTGHVL